MQASDLIIRGAIWKGEPSDLFVRKGRILELRPYSGSERYDGGKVVDAKGLTLLPSLIDAHAHLREPGYEYKEDIASGLRAASQGGFGTVMCMANTLPVNDTGQTTRYMLAKARESWPRGPRLFPIGALTIGLEGKELAPMAELSEAGCAAFSNDGKPVASTEIFRRAVEYASDLDKRVIDHCEDPYLNPAAGMNEGALSGRLGLRAQPTIAESIQAARDILLASYLDQPIHLAHVSCRESVELIAWAKAKGIPVTAETAPHYLLLTEDAAAEYDPMAKVNPPLRTMDDVEAVRQGLRQGVIDMLATDHAPHAEHEKDRPFEEAALGVSGLDSALSLTWELAVQGILDQETFIRAWTTAPGKTFGLPYCAFQPGDMADFILLDADARRTLTPESMRSKGKNTPFLGRTLLGQVKSHYIEGKQII